MRYILILLSCLMVTTACNQTTTQTANQVSSTLPEPMNASTETYFGYPDDVTLGVLLDNAGLQVPTTVMQHGNQFLFIRTEGNQQILCTNLDNTDRCITKDKQEQEGFEERVNAVSTSIQRVLLRDVALTPEKTITLDVDQGLPFVNNEMLPESMKGTSLTDEDVLLGSCYLLTEGDDKAVACYDETKRFMPSFTYILSSELGSIQSKQQLYYLSLSELSEERLRQVYTSFTEELTP